MSHFQLHAREVKFDMTDIQNSEYFRGIREKDFRLTRTAKAAVVGTKDFEFDLTAEEATQIAAIVEDAAQIAFRRGIESQSQAVDIDGRVRIRCKTCGAVSGAIYRYFPGDIHVAASYGSETLREFFAEHARCVNSEAFYAGTLHLEFVTE